MGRFSTPLYLWLNYCSITWLCSITMLLAVAFMLNSRPLQILPFFPNLFSVKYPPRVRWPPRCSWSSRRRFRQWPAPTGPCLTLQPKQGGVGSFSFRAEKKGGKLLHPNVFFFTGFNVFGLNIGVSREKNRGQMLNLHTSCKETDWICWRMW